MRATAPPLRPRHGELPPVLSGNGGCAFTPRLDSRRYARSVGVACLEYRQAPAIPHPGSNAMSRPTSPTGVHPRRNAPAPRPLALTRIETRIGGRRLPRGGSPEDRLGRALTRWGPFVASRCLYVLLNRCTCVLKYLINVSTRYVLRAYAREPLPRGTTSCPTADGEVRATATLLPQLPRLNACQSRVAGGRRTPARMGADGQLFVKRPDPAPAGAVVGRGPGLRRRLPSEATIDFIRTGFQGGVSYRKQWEGMGAPLGI